MEYNEYDDYGTGWEEAAEREYDRQEEAGVEAWREGDALWGATMAEDIAALLKR